jgi:hypothetical protein
LPNSQLIGQSRRNFDFLFHLYSAHQLSIWNSSTLICTLNSATACKLSGAQISGAVMKAVAKKARVQTDQGNSPYSAVACLVLLLFAGILVKFAAATSIFHFAHWN